MIQHHQHPTQHVGVDDLFPAGQDAQLICRTRSRRAKTWLLLARLVLLSLACSQARAWETPRPLRIGVVESIDRVVLTSNDADHLLDRLVCIDGAGASTGTVAFEACDESLWERDAGKVQGACGQTLRLPDSWPSDATCRLFRSMSLSPGRPMADARDTVVRQWAHQRNLANPRVRAALTGEALRDWDARPILLHYGWQLPSDVLLQVRGDSIMLAGDWNGDLQFDAAEVVQGDLPPKSTGLVLRSQSLTYAVWVGDASGEHPERTPFWTVRIRQGDPTAHDPWNRPALLGIAHQAAPDAELVWLDWERGPVDLRHCLEAAQRQHCDMVCVDLENSAAHPFHCLRLLGSLSREFDMPILVRRRAACAPEFVVHPAWTDMPDAGYWLSDRLVNPQIDGLSLTLAVSRLAQCLAGAHDLGASAVHRYYAGFDDAADLWRTNALALGDPAAFRQATPPWTLELTRRDAHPATLAPSRWVQLRKTTTDAFEGSIALPDNRLHWRGDTQGLEIRTDSRPSKEAILRVDGANAPRLSLVSLSGFDAQGRRRARLPLVLNSLTEKADPSMMTTLDPTWFVAAIPDNALDATFCWDDYGSGISVDHLQSRIVLDSQGDLANDDRWNNYFGSGCYSRQHVLKGQGGVLILGAGELSRPRGDTVDRSKPPSIVFLRGQFDESLRPHSREEPPAELSLQNASPASPRELFETAGALWRPYLPIARELVPPRLVALAPEETPRSTSYWYHITGSPRSNGGRCFLVAEPSMNDPNAPPRETAEWTRRQSIVQLREFDHAGRPIGEPSVNRTVDAVQNLGRWLLAEVCPLDARQNADDPSWRRPPRVYECIALNSSADLSGEPAFRLAAETTNAGGSLAHYQGRLRTKDAPLQPGERAIAADLYAKVTIDESRQASLMVGRLALQDDSERFHRHLDRTLTTPWLAHFHADPVQASLERQRNQGVEPREILREALAGWRKEPELLSANRRKLAALDQAELRKQHLEQVVEAADRVLQLCPREGADGETASQLFAWKVDALYRKGRALGYMELPDVVKEHPILDQQRLDQQFAATFDALDQLVDMNAPEFVLLNVRRLRRGGYPGLAYAALRQYLAQKPDASWFAKKQRDLLVEMELGLPERLGHAFFFLQETRSGPSAP